MPDVLGSFRSREIFEDTNWYVYMLFLCILGHILSSEHQSHLTLITIHCHLKRVITFPPVSHVQLNGMYVLLFI